MSARRNATVSPDAAPAPGPRRSTTGRIGIEDVAPVLAYGRGVKAVVGEALPVSATIVGDGHGALGAQVVLRDPAGTVRSRITLLLQVPGTDRRSAWVRPDGLGDWTFTVEAWTDPVLTWLLRAQIKVPAGLDAELELTEGSALLAQALKGLPRGRVRDPLKAAVARLRDPAADPVERLTAVMTPDVLGLLESFPLRVAVTESSAHPIRVERERALVGSWYEFFPRSEGASLDPPRSGTFVSAAERLPAIAEMGFDVVYLTPIHPIGTSFRKGPNNSTVAGPDDPGSPWAIGSPDGGHDAIHPGLGSQADFDSFVRRAGELGMEVALDLALQCSPDHPWVSEHPEWFLRRADGSIAYAENPPKKYQDIYPLSFDTDPEGLYAEVLRVVQHWMTHGVRIFRVDNPHTKPVAFWERLIWEVNASDPDVLFLAEAFTRPAMMRLLGEIGFQQSYTYFTWRNEKWELEEYLRELAGPLSASMRPNLFVNTPDILSAYLQYGGPAAFAIRATLAATLSPTWGVYSGFELYEHVAVRPGSEEYLDSEKYQYRPRDWSHAPLAGYLTRLNEIRRDHPALHHLRNLRFHASDNEGVICFSKRLDPAPGMPADTPTDTVLVVVNLDPHAVRETTVRLDMPALGMDWAEQFDV
ncbi:MAG: alpha-1,4-glucan--maltose-1-phosphate maltosyltransferase, partial [Candidatus Nanopelagicales bacterium]